MLKVKIIAMGKLKEEYLRLAQNEYSKRLSAFCKTEIVQIPAQKLSDEPTLAQINQCLSKEAQKIRKEIPLGSCVCSLCIEGEEISSDELARKIEKVSVNGFSTLVFIIGSSFGLDEHLKKECAYRLSFSKMTFPHQLARIMLLEQVYRAFSINSNTKYHK